MKTIEDLGDLRGKRVLVRSDFNVPLDGTTITDDGRIRAALPTLTSLLAAGARVIVTAHLGRPKGAPEAKYSLAPVQARLAELLGQPVERGDDLAGAGVPLAPRPVERGGGRTVPVNGEHRVDLASQPGQFVTKLRTRRLQRDRGVFDDGDADRVVRHDRKRRQVRGDVAGPCG